METEGTGSDLTLREQQLVELRLLKTAAEYYEKNGIRYLLCGGTLIGALRHKGFIPWDDDIDMLIPREDYERLKELIRRDRPSFDNGHIRFGVPGDSHYPFAYIRMSDDRTVINPPSYKEDFSLSVWIDIFPLDHFPKNRLLHRLQLTRIAIWRVTVLSQTRKSIRHYSAVHRLAAWFLSLFFRYEKCCQKIDRGSRRMDRLFSKSGFSGNGAFPKGGMRDYYADDSIYPAGETRVPFEGLSFSAPFDPDRFLKFYFTDYMTLPPESERVYHYKSGEKVWASPEFKKELAGETPSAS